MRSERRLFLAAALALALLTTDVTVASPGAGDRVARSQAVRTADPSPLPSDLAIRRILADRLAAISPSPDGIGIIVGVIEPAGQRIVALGHRSKSDRRQPDGDTAFEIGSLTKVFTGLLLAEMAQRGEVSMTDTAAKLLAGTVTVPSRGRQPITLLDLATHTSGLPFMPELPSEGTAAPYAKADLVRFVNAYKPSSPGPARWEYSNLGYWLLGEALASRASQDFEDLLHTRVLAPLGARRSGFALSPGMRANLAVGHDASLEPAPALSTQPVFAMMSAAGGLYSSTNDLLKVMAIGLAYERSPLTAAMKVSVATRRPAAGHGDEQALGWTVIKDDGSELIFRDGGTFGYSSCVAWHPANRMGVVVLSNHVAGVSDIARHLLRPGFPLEPPATLRRRTEVQLPAATLDRYVGRYDAGSEGIFRIARKGTFLMFESPADWGLPALRIRPESARDFFASELPLRVTVESDANGRVTGILIYPPRGQKPVPARRLGV